MGEVVILAIGSGITIGVIVVAEKLFHLDDEDIFSSKR